VKIPPVEPLCRAFLGARLHFSVMPNLFNHLKPGGCLAAILTLALAPTISAAGVPLASVSESDSSTPVHRDTIRFFRSQAPASFLGYTVVHPVQTARGISRQVTCEIRLTQDTLGSAIACWAQVDTFVSGSEGRDGAMRDAVEWLEYPEVSFTGNVAAKVMAKVIGKAKANTNTKAPSHSPQSKWEIAGELDFHGTRRPLQFQATLAEQGQAVLIQGAFALSLTDHKVARPVLLFKPTEDTVRIDMHLVMQGFTVR
jgi:YceI-like domain